MKLEIDSIEIRKYKDKHHVRINIGDYMFFDSDMTTKQNAQAIFNNLDGRIKND